METCKLSRCKLISSILCLSRISICIRTDDASTPLGYLLTLSLSPNSGIGFVLPLRGGGVGKGDGHDFKCMFPEMMTDYLEIQSIHRKEGIADLVLQFVACDPTQIQYYTHFRAMYTGFNFISVST